MAGGRPANPRELVPVGEIMTPQQVMQTEYRLMDLIPAVDSKEKAMRWLATRGLLRNHVLCRGCGDRMALVRKAWTIDGKRWKCSGQCPGSTKSIRHGSWFEKSRLDLAQCILLLYFWASDTPQDQIAHELNISRNTVVDWSNFTREICVEDLRLHPQQIGGVDDNFQPIVVEIDESKYFHRKYQRGQWREGHWVFGGIERGSGKCFLVEVPDRSRATLEPVIERSILPGSHIISDGWAAYRNLDRLGGGIYTHDAVVHDQHFVDPNDPEIHTNNVENMWMRSKRKLKRQFGTSRVLFDSYLNEFVWRSKDINRQHQCFARLLCCIREQY